MAYPFAFSHLLFPFLIYLSFTSSAISDQIPSSFASTQIQFWSENVKNKMPASISAKLSPLTKQESDYYNKTISQSNFKADTKFCSLAKLACSTIIDEFKVVIDESGVYYKNSKAATPPLEKIDPASFFRLSILKEGNTIHLSNLQKPLPFRAFLPPKIASKISSTSEEITKIFPKSCKEATDTTIYYCNSAAMKGESKACPKSLEEVISFAKTTLGESKLMALASESTRGSGKELTIKKIKQFNVEKIVTCHELFLPFATYYCHSLSSSRIYSVDFIESKKGAPVNTAVAMCHMDTTNWSKNHISFKILKFGPGQGEVCHWMSEIDLAWIADGE